MLIHTSKHNNAPVARLDCCFGTNRIYGQNECTACRNYFEPSIYDSHTDICVGDRVAISKVNYLPEIGLYNGAIGTAVEIVYIKTNRKDPMTKNTTIDRTMLLWIFQT